MRTSPWVTLRAIAAYEPVAARRSQHRSTLSNRYRLGFETSNWSFHQLCRQIARRRHRGRGAGATRSGSAPLPHHPREGGCARADWREYQGVTIHRSDPSKCVRTRLSVRTRRSVTVLVFVALMAAGCSDDRDDVETEVTSEATTEREDPVAAAEARVEEAESGVADSQKALEAAGEQFCADAESYIEVLDRYGKLFTDDAATVGDIQTLGADLVDPRETVAASVNEVEEAKTATAEAALELADAQAALVEAIATASSVPASSTTPATTTTTTLVPQATIERVQQAEDDLAQTGEGITAATPLAEATAEYNSAAFALQIAWLRLLYDAGCLSDEQQAKAVEQVTAYTATLQTELQQVGYYEGAIDGIYGPATVEAVKRLQADSDLPETGFVDRATAGVLDDLLAELELQTAAADLTHTPRSRPCSR